MKRKSRRLTAFVLAAAMMAQGAVSAAPALAADDAFTPVATTDKQYTGYENGQAPSTSPSSAATTLAP